MTIDHWAAKWIWAAGTTGQNDVYIEARKTFELQETAGKAQLRISANQAYKLYVNGTEVGRGPAPADLAWMSYDVYEVAGHLVAGTNVLAVAANNFGDDMIVTQQLQGPGGLICQLDLFGSESGDSEPIRTIASGADWKCRRSSRWKRASRLHLWGGYREIYDAAQEDGWESAAYDDRPWQQAELVATPGQPDSPWPRLLPREIPSLSSRLVRPTAVIAAEAYLGSMSDPETVLADAVLPKPLELDASVPGSIPQVTYDFGAEIVGYPRLEVFAEEGGVLQVFVGESLEMVLTNTYLLRKGMNKLSSFGRRAFRYMKIAVMATPVPISVMQLETESVHYPFEDHATFNCSDERLNQIWETGRYTTIVNSQDHFEDCPYREAALWVADAVVMAKAVYHISGDAALVRKSLLQGARIQNEDGSIPGTGPQRNSFMLPDFCAHWLFGAWEYYTHSRDEAFLDEIWPNVLRLADWFEAQEDSSGLFARADREGWWCFIDWSDDIERKDRVTAISCFYYKFLETAACMAEERGEHEHKEGFTAKAKLVRESIRSLLRVPGTGLYADCMTDQALSSSVTAQTNFAAAWSGIMDEKEVKAFIEAYYLEGKLPPIRGAFFYHIVLETLFRYRYTEEAIQLIRDYWGAMLDRGATTWWETFDPSLPFPTVPSPYLGHTPTYLQDAVPVSFSHGWGASPTYLLSQELLGVNMSAAGTKGVALQPQAVHGIDWASGVIPTASGDINAEWRREVDGKLRFQASLPNGLAWTAIGLEDLAIEPVEGGRTRVTGRMPEAAPKLSRIGS